SLVPVAPRELLPDVPGDLDALCVELLRIDPGSRPPEREILSRLRVPSRAAPPAAPFLGRTVELGALEGALAAALGEGETGPQALAVLVHGESGVGKTALLRHFIEGLPATRGGTLLCRGRCHERESVPYKAVDGVIDAVSRHLRELGASVEAVLPRERG